MMTMTTLRRVLTTGLALLAGSVAASASTLTIGYSTTISATPTDITDVLAAVLPSWNPGGSDATLSNVVGTGYTTGISMSSLTGGIYTLTGFNITVKETLSGSYTVTNDISASSNAQGTAYIDTYTAVALGGPLAPALSSTVDPSNDLFTCNVTLVGKTATGCPGTNPGEQNTSLGGGPDPASASTANFNLAPGASFNSGAINVNSKWVDYGCEVLGNSFCNESNIANAIGNELSSSVNGSLGLADVTGSSGLTFDFSTLTSTDTQVTGGNLSSQYNTQVSEQIAVTYTYTQTADPTPEPATMGLMGGALVGLGLMRKRFAKR
jgi:hypothetical protein